MHCSKSQQMRTAELMRQIFGEMLLMPSEVTELAATADGGAYVSHFMTDAPTAPLPAAASEAPPPPALAALADDELAVAPLSALGGGPPPPFDDILAVPAAAPDAADAAAAVAAGGAGDGATPA